MFAPLNEWNVCWMLFYVIFGASGSPREKKLHKLLCEITFCEILLLCEVLAHNQSRAHTHTHSPAQSHEASFASNVVNKIVLYFFRLRFVLLLWVRLQSFRNAAFLCFSLRSPLSFIYSFWLMRLTPKGISIEARAQFYRFFSVVHSTAHNRTQQMDSRPCQYLSKINTNLYCFHSYNHHHQHHNGARGRLRSRIHTWA